MDSVSGRGAGRLAELRRPSWPGSESRRRPSGREHPAHRRPPRTVWVALGALALSIGALGAVRLAAQSPGLIQDVDGAVRSALRTIPGMPETAGVLDRFAARLGFGLLWLPCGLVLAWYARWRSLLVYLGTVSVIAAVAQLAVGDAALARAVREQVTGSASDVVVPAWPVVVLAAVLTATLFALVPAGRPRRWGWVCVVLLTAAMAATRIFLGLDSASATVASAWIGGSAATLVFLVLVPESDFPVVYHREVKAHLRLDGARRERISIALRDQFGITVDELRPYRLDGSAGSTPCRLVVADGPPDALFGKLYALNHLRSDRWYKVARVLLYGRMEDEAPFSSVRRLAEHEDYMLRLLRDGGVRVPEPWGVCEVVPGREYLLVTEFVPGAVELLDSGVPDVVIDDALGQVRRLWWAGAAHRDIKPSNLLVSEQRVYLVDVAFGELRPSRWREAVDLANMMLSLALVAGPERVVERASGIFDPMELAEAFAATSSVTVPHQVRRLIAESGRDLIADFRALLPAHEHIRIQRWSLRRIWLAVGSLGGAVLLVALVTLNLRAGGLL